MWITMRFNSLYDLQELKEGEYDLIPKGENERLNENYVHTVKICEKQGRINKRLREGLKTIFEMCDCVTSDIEKRVRNVAKAVLKETKQ